MNVFTVKNSLAELPAADGKVKYMKAHSLKTARYALYYAPRPGSVLAGCSREWLYGQGLGPELEERLLTAPRHYGFHATLKPPFSLQEGRAEADFLQAVSELAVQVPPVKISGLHVLSLGSFLALRCDKNKALSGLAAACVTVFEIFRKPLTEAGLARKRAVGLTKEQDELLVQWGYPYVMEEFRFHMTLTGNLEKQEFEEIKKQAEVIFQPALSERHSIEDICVFFQPDKDTPFVELTRFALQGEV